MLIRSMSPLKLSLAQTVSLLVLLYVFMKESCPSGTEDEQAEEDEKEEEKARARARAGEREMVNPSADAPSLKLALVEKKDAPAQFLWWMTISAL